MVIDDGKWDHDPIREKCFVFIYCLGVEHGEAFTILAKMFGAK